MKIAISAESTIDLPKELLQKFDIHTVPFTVIMGDNVYLDGEFDNTKLFEYFDKNRKLPSTSAVNEYQYKEHFENLLKDYDAVIHLSLSSGVSSAYRNAQNVANEMNNVYVIDTLSLSTGIALLALKAREMVDNNVDILDIVKYLEENKLKSKVSLIVNKLNYIVKGGRCSALACFGANLLSIKPLITVVNGKTKLGKKYIGSYDFCAKKYCEDIIKSSNNIDKKNIFVSYTTITEKTKETVTQILKDNGFENIYYTTAGSTISCHTGPLALGIIFMEK